MTTPPPKPLEINLAARIQSRLEAAVAPRRPPVLIAEDDLVSAKVLEKLLQKLGYEVVSARDGDEAWRLFQAQPTRLIVSDWMMPGTDGLSFCEKVRAHPGLPYTYFILLTANGPPRKIMRSRPRPGSMIF